MKQNFAYVFILISNKKARELISSHIKSRFYLLSFSTFLTSLHLGINIHISNHIQKLTGYVVSNISNPGKLTISNIQIIVSMA